MRSLKEIVKLVARESRPEFPFMPGRQPCPYLNCGKGSKRDRKTLAGAYYQCPNHGMFLVKSPGAEPLLP